ncbi:MAG: hypothetical protein AAF919_12425 [Pseudomonadota bacterium]
MSEIDALVNSIPADTNSDDFTAFLESDEGVEIVSQIAVLMALTYTDAFEDIKNIIHG